MKKFIFCISLTLIGYSVLVAHSNDDIKEMSKLIEASNKISSMYVDKVDEHKLVENAISGILNNLDPHSIYIPREEVKKMNEPLVGNFDGIGVQFQIISDTVYVEQTISGGPSEKVGILPGDRIITVNDSSIVGKNVTTTYITEKLRGKKGTKVNVKIIRREQENPLDFVITRDKIPLVSIDASYMIEPTIGYIKLSKFSETSKAEFETAFRKLQKQGMKDLILDLGNNGGGYLKTATQIADEFLKSGQLIVYTKNRNEDRDNYKASSHGYFEEGRLVILVNAFTASASEILSGAIQDWDRGLIVGQRTYGKGLVQQPVFLSDGSMMRLTTARYYTPSGRCIQRSYKDGIEKYKEEVIKRYNDGELAKEDEIHFPDSLKKETMISHRNVYGGGGIMPDYYVPVDTSYESNYLTELINKGTLYSFTSQCIEKYGKIWKNKYSNCQSFIKEFEVADTLLDKLNKQALKEKIKYNENDFKKSKQFLMLQIKALFARHLWGPNEYFEVTNQDNRICQKALEILNTKGKYDSLLNHQSK